MVRILVHNGFDEEKDYIEAAGLSTDAKPSEKIVTGSRYIEVDSGNEYRFDEVSGQWYEKQGVEM